MKEVFHVHDSGQLYRAFQRVMNGERIAAVSRGVRGGVSVVTVEWGKTPRKHGVIKLIEEIEECMK